MGKFVIAPHMRLQEWVAEEKDYFRQEGLDYEFYDVKSHVSAIKTAQQLAEEHNLELRILDERDLDGLAEVFLPGMLLEVRRRKRGRESFTDKRRSIE